MGEIIKKILFLTLAKVETISERGIYTDLIRKFIENRHEITIVSPYERREHKNTSFIVKESVNFLNVRTFNIKKTNIFEKGIGTLAIEFQYLQAIKKYTRNITYDLILYSTPPITFFKVIQYIKNRDHAKSYLLLKDIFPQNAIDMGLLKKDSLLHNLFKRKEKKLYEISDYIGCMSQANVDFIKNNNSYIDANKIEINPNSIDPKIIQNETICLKRQKLRDLYQINSSAVIFLYGGNLGVPQGLDFFCNVLEKSKNNQQIFFIIIGNGTRYNLLQNCIEHNQIKNAVLLPGVSKNEYDNIIAGCDVGLIFLDQHFTIPNFPSRLLSYLENKMPVIAATDPITDIGDIIEEWDAGYKVMSGDYFRMLEILQYYIKNPTLIKKQGEHGFLLLMEKYTVDKTYNLIINKI